MVLVPVNQWPFLNQVLPKVHEQECKSKLLTAQLIDINCGCDKEAAIEFFYITASECYSLVHPVAVAKAHANCFLGKLLVDYVLRSQATRLDK